MKGSGIWSNTKKIENLLGKKGFWKFVGCLEGLRHVRKLTGIVNYLSENDLNGYLEGPDLVWGKNYHFLSDLKAKRKYLLSEWGPKSEILVSYENWPKIVNIKLIFLKIKKYCSILFRKLFPSIKMIKGLKGLKIITFWVISSRIWPEIA